MSHARPPVDKAAAVQFGVELSRLRTMAGMSQRSLGKLILTSGQQVGAVERADRNPSKKFAELADQALSANGALLNLWPGMRRPVHHWLEEFEELENKSQVIQEFQCQAVPGLLQTSDYARTVLGASWPPNGEDEVERLLRSRMRRQELLERQHPPMLWAIVDEGALRRTVGNVATMAAQLDHLLSSAQRPHINIQVLTFERGAHAAMDGSFFVLELSPTEGVGYAEIPGSGHVIADADSVANCVRRFGSLRSLALSPGETIEFIMQLRGALNHGDTAVA